MQADDTRPGRRAAGSSEIAFGEARPLGSASVSDNMLVAVITAIATLVGAFGGVLIANWHARKMRRLDLAEARRLEQRDAIAELIDAARSYAPKLDALVAGIAHLDDYTKAPREEAGAARARCSKALTVAMLTVTDDELREHVSHFSLAFNRDDIVLPVLKARMNGTDVRKPLDRALELAKDMENEIANLDAAATRVLLGLEESSKAA